MRSEINDLAWVMLTDEEKMALSLQLGYGKSTWEAGEIMGKAHYKYLEIKQRGEKLLLLFTDYLEAHQSIIPLSLEGDIPDNTKKLLNSLIGQRVAIKESTTLAGFKSPKQRDEAITTFLEYCKSNLDRADVYSLLELVLTYDRWNSFRVLPQKYQEPSAYKRRNKNRYKKSIRRLRDANTLIFERLPILFPHTKPSPLVYIPYIKHKKSELITVGDNPQLWARLTAQGLYGFSSKAEAIAYTELLVSFIYIKNPTCRQGLVFWPAYRQLIEKAVNFKELEMPLVDRPLDYAIEIPTSDN